MLSFNLFLKAHNQYYGSKRILQFMSEIDKLRDIVINKVTYVATLFLSASGWLISHSIFLLR